MANLYETEDWRRLEGTGRAELLLVNEGLKRGTIIGGRKKDLYRVLDQTDLGYQIVRKHLLRIVLRVAKPDILAEFDKRISAIDTQTNRNIRQDQYDRSNGWLFSYPDCCVEQYCAGALTEKQEEQFTKENRHLSYRFGRELDEVIRNTGTYPDVFDFCPPSFTPCSVNCPNAIALLNSYKEALLRIDPGAANDLVYLNRRSLPERLVHEEYLKNEKERRKNEEELIIMNMNPIIRFLWRLF